MAEIASLNVLDASNTDRFPSNMPPSNVDNGMRALEGMIARADKDNNGSLTTAGSSTAYTVTLNSQHPAWFTGLTFVAKIDETCGATPTINPTGSTALGAKSLYAGTTAIAAGILVANTIYKFVYDGTNVQVMNVGQFGAISASSYNTTLTVNATTAAAALAGTQASLTLQTNDNGAIGSAISGTLNSTTPANNDLLLFIDGNGKDSGGVDTNYTRIWMYSTVVTGGSERGTIEFGTTTNGSMNSRMALTLGGYMAGATGGDKGVGTLNAVGVYANGIPGIFRLGGAVKTDTASIAITGGTFSPLTGMSVSGTLAAGESAIIKGYVSLGTSGSSINVGIRVKRDSTVIGQGDTASNRSRVSAVAVLADNAGCYTIPIYVIDAAPGAGTYTWSLEATTESNVTLYMNRENTDADASTTFRASSWIEVLKVVA